MENNREPFWGPNWYILPLMFLLVIVLTWIKGPYEKNRVVDLGGGITIRKVSDERSDKLIVRQLSPN